MRNNSKLKIGILMKIMPYHSKYLSNYFGTYKILFIFHNS